MAFVEHKPCRWADKITVEHDGDTLHVHGQNSADGVWRDPEPQSPDLLKAYAEYARQSKPLPGHLRGGRLAPHVEFANATTDEQLIKFVSLYGPVNGLRPIWNPLPKGKLRSVAVTESLRRLRRERMVFAAAIRLVCALSEGSEIGVANALGDLALAGSQGQAEWYGHVYTSQLSVMLREAGWPLGVPMDEGLRVLRGNLVRQCGGLMLCLVLNSFPSMLVPAKRGLIEMPFLSNGGILPALYFMLRRDCLLDQAIRICDRRDCGKFFKVERGGQRFCSTDCSQLQRQRDYWERRGKDVRAQRIARKRNKKGGKKRGTV